MSDDDHSEDDKLTYYATRVANDSLGPEDPEEWGPGVETDDHEPADCEDSEADCDSLPPEDPEEWGPGVAERDDQEDP